VAGVGLMLCSTCGDGVLVWVVCEKGRGDVLRIAGLWVQVRRAYFRIGSP
jgi:hypothetical protein